MSNGKKMKRHNLPPLTSIQDLGEVNHNRHYKSFRLRSGWTGEKREKYIPGKHRCPECGGRLSHNHTPGGEKDTVRCDDCGSDFPVDWSTYRPGVIG